MCLPFQVINLFMLPMMHLGALQISIWKTGKNNPDRQVIIVKVSAPSSLFPNSSNESAREISSALRICFQHLGHNTHHAKRWLEF